MHQHHVATSVSRRAVAIVSVALAVAACSSQSSASDRPTTTVAARASTHALLDYAKRGPYGVGVTTLRLGTDSSAADDKAEVWYPSPTKGGSTTYDVRDFLPDAFLKLVPATVKAEFTYAATRDAAAAAGKFPVVLFSHGFSGMRDQSAFLTSHLASWGMIVAAPDHPSRDLKSILGGGRGAGSSVDDLLKTLALVASEGTRAGSPLDGHVGTRVVAVGHSAGGATVMEAARDGRIAAYVSLASGRLDGVAAGSQPAKPALFVAGRDDHVVTLDVPQAAYDGAPATAPTWLVIIDRAGHNAFDDFCTIGPPGAGGIIGLAEQAGLGQVVPESLKALGRDGCVAPARPVREVWPAIQAVVTAFCRYETGLDGSAAALKSSEVARLNSQVGGVTIAARHG